MPKDFKKQFSSVEELESLLDEEFAETGEQEEELVDGSEEVKQEEGTDEQETETETEEDVSGGSDVEVEDDGEVELEEDEEASTEVQKVFKPTKQEKEAYAFKQLREEKRALEQEQKQLEDLAKSYGYKSHKDFMNALKEQRIQEEAKNKNVPYEEYKRVYDLEDKVKVLEQERMVTQRTYKTQEINAALTKVAKEGNLTPAETEQIVISLEQDGYTIDDLLAVKNPERLFKGYASDIIIEKRANKVASKINKVKSNTSQPHKSQSKPPEKTLDEMVEEDLKKYARNAGIRF